jgi:hypothetical protein
MSNNDEILRLLHGLTNETQTRAREQLLGSMCSSSVALFIGAFCGFVGICSANKARERNVGYDYKKDQEDTTRTKKMELADLISRMPSTVSENIHDTTTAHGTTFKAMMLLLALLCLTSNFPAYEKCVSFPIGGNFVFAFRLFTPAIGILLLVLVPSNKDVLAMMQTGDSFADLRGQVTVEQRHQYLMSEVQDTVHRVGGLIGMAATAFLEFGNLTYVMIHWYFYDGVASGTRFCGLNPSQLPRFVDLSKHDGLLADWTSGDAISMVSLMWFIVGLARLSVCLAIFPTLGRYVYETGPCRADQRCRCENPDYSYFPEIYAIEQLTAYVLLTGLGVLYTTPIFFESLTWEIGAGLSGQFVLIAITAVVIICIAVRVPYQVWFVLRINAFLAPAVHEKRIWAYIVRYEQDLRDGSAVMKRLEELRKRAVGRLDRKRIRDHRASSDGGSGAPLLDKD